MNKIFITILGFLLLFSLFGCSAEANNSVTPLPSDLPTPKITVSATNTPDYKFSNELETITRENVNRLELIARFGIGNIYGISLSPDGKTIAVGTNTGLYLFNSSNGRQTGFINLQIGKKESCSYLLQKDNVTFSPDGKFIAIGNKEISIWDIEAEKLHSVFSDNDDFLVTKIEISPDGRYVVATWSDIFGPCEIGDSMFTIHDIESGKLILKKHFSHYIDDYDFSLTDLGYVYFYSYGNKWQDKFISKINISSGYSQEFNGIDLGEFYYFSPDGSLLAIYETSDLNAEDVNILVSSRLIELNGMSEVLTSENFFSPLPNSENILIYQTDKWKIQTVDGDAVCTFSYSGEEKDFPAFQDYWKERTYYASSMGSISPLEISLNGKIAISHGWFKDKIWVWDLEKCTISTPILFSPKRQMKLGFSTSEQYLFTEHWGSTKKRYYQWNIETGNAILLEGDFESEGIKYEYETVNSSREMIAYTNFTETERIRSGILIEDIKTGDVLLIIPETDLFLLTEGQLYMAFSNSDRYFAALSSDGIIHIWGVKKE